MYPAAQNKPLARLQEAGFTAGLVIQEIMQTKPGRQADYIRELERLYVPWSERTGKRWLGSFITTFRYNEVIHYWALDGEWETFAEHYPSFGPEPDPEVVQQHVGLVPRERAVGELGADGLPGVDGHVSDRLSRGHAPPGHGPPGSRTSGPARWCHRARGRCGWQSVL